MSGAVAAHAAYNGSGTQGLAVTNKISDQSTDVMSVFWNKNDTTRQLLHGSTILEVPASGNTGNPTFGGSKIFTINNDIDCLGELYVNMKIDVKNQFTLSPFSVAGASATAASGTLPVVTAGTFDTAAPRFTFKLGALTNIIDRIEYQVGTQIWQTLEKDDVRVIYNTEMSEGAYDTVGRRSRPERDLAAGETPGVYATTAANYVAGDTVDCTFIIPSLTKTLAPQLETYSNITESGYPLAAAPHQSVKIKIYFPSTSNVKLVIPEKSGADAIAQNSFLDMTVTDSPYLETMSIKSTNASALVTTTTNSTQATALDIGPAPLAIRSVKLFAKHLIMCNEERESMKNMPLGLPKRLKMSQSSMASDVKGVTSKTIDLDHFSLYSSHIIISGNLGEDVYIKTAELKFNSSSYSGVLPAQLLDYAACESLGLYVNRTVGATGVESLDGTGNLIFPLASIAYGGSSIPLNRFDSIRLSLTFSGAPTGDSPYVNITCLGETTALFKGGAASLAMY